jgi:hypothetical protein
MDKVEKTALATLAGLLKYTHVATYVRRAALQHLRLRALRFLVTLALP